MTAIKNKLINSKVELGDNTFSQFEAEIAMAVKHGKMTEERGEEICLLGKNVIEGMTREKNEFEVDLTVVEDDDQRRVNDQTLCVDMAVISFRHLDDGKHVQISIATAVATIAGAN